MSFEYSPLPPSDLPAAVAQADAGKWFDWFRTDSLLAYAINRRLADQLIRQNLPYAIISLIKEPHETDDTSIVTTVQCEGNPNHTLLVRQIVQQRTYPSLINTGLPTQETTTLTYAGAGEAIAEHRTRLLFQDPQIQHGNIDLEVATWHDAEGTLAPTIQTREDLLPVITIGRFAGSHPSPVKNIILTLDANELRQRSPNMLMRVSTYDVLMNRPILDNELLEAHTRRTFAQNGTILPEYVAINADGTLSMPISFTGPSSPPRSLDIPIPTIISWQDDTEMICATLLDDETEVFP